MNLTQDIFINSIIYNDLPLIETYEINNSWKSNDFSITNIAKVSLHLFEVQGIKY
jgi:hypothetical protein